MPCDRELCAKAGLTGAEYDVYSADSLYLRAAMEGEALKCGFTWHVESFGVRQAVKVVKVAVGFGGRVAYGWLNGLGFARYLAFIDYN